jgi:hypothetical protein
MGATVTLATCEEKASSARLSCQGQTQEDISITAQSSTVEEDVGSRYRCELGIDGNGWSSCLSNCPITRHER